MKLTKLKNGKYKIVLNNGNVINTYDEIIIKNKLLYKKDLTDKDIELILKHNNYYDIYNQMIKFLSKKRRSRKEAIEHINKICNIKKDSDSIIAKMEELKLINDYEFASAYVNDKIYLSNIGPNRIYSDLLLHDVDENIIKEVIANIDYQEIYNKLEKIIIKKIKNNKKYGFNYLKNKLIIELINNGYDKIMINDVLSTIEVSDDGNLINEYNKLKNKYSKKYVGYELNNKIKEKLYQKGYSIDKINQIIN